MERIYETNCSLSPEYEGIIQRHAKRLFEDFSINDSDYHEKMLKAEEDMNNMINKWHTSDEIDEPYGEDKLAEEPYEMEDEKCPLCSRGYLMPMYDEFPNGIKFCPSCGYRP